MSLRYMGVPDRCRHGEYEDKCVACECDRLRADLAACLRFIENECNWCDFRGEMYSDTESIQNARKLAEFLDRFNADKMAKGGE